MATDCSYGDVACSGPTTTVTVRASNRLLGVETLDHPSDAELVVFARRHFRRIDALYGPR